MGERQLEKNETNCGYKCGSLPECAPLAVATIPAQASSQPAYDAPQALSRGTLFPGLDLPFMNVVNKTMSADTPLAELMAIDFVADEMELYLDTHPNDQEAFETYQSFLRLAKEAHRRYTERYGPIDQSDMLSAERYTWVDAPWPWEYKER